MFRLTLLDISVHVAPPNPEAVMYLEVVSLYSRTAVHLPCVSYITLFLDKSQRQDYHIRNQSTTECNKRVQQHGLNITRSVVCCRPSPSYQSIFLERLFCSTVQWIYVEVRLISYTIVMTNPAFTTAIFDVVAYALPMTQVNWYKKLLAAT